MERRQGWTGYSYRILDRLKFGALGLGLTLAPEIALAGGDSLPPEWSRVDNSLVTVCYFADFVTTVDFVNNLVEPAERLGHHPDLAIAYNRLDIRLTTHDAGGITDLDLALAKEISALQEGQCQLP